MKPTSFVGNTCYMITKIMKSKSSGQVYYLADYPQGSVQDWANHIHKAYGKRVMFQQFLLFYLRR